jgi:hypothetical protein
MSETVNCPDCDEKVTLKPGKAQVTCPACGGRFAVEGPSARTDRTEKPAKKKPKRKYREDWDDDDDKDDKPPKPVKQGGSLAWLWITLGIVAVIAACCGGVGWGGYVLVQKAREEAQARLDRFEQQMNAQPGNPAGRPKPPKPADASFYPRKKLFEVDPALAAKPSPVYLDDLQPFDVRQGEWPLGRNGALGYDDRWVCVNGQYADHGMGMIPPNNGAARASFAVGGLARRVKGKVALCGFWHDGEAHAPVTFAVYKDGKEVWRSRPVKQRKVQPQEFDIDITGARVITLETNAPDSAHDAHCVWIDPVIEK